MAIHQISNSEHEIMRSVWGRQGQAMYADIVEDLENKNLQWKKNTILTYLARLVEKGLLDIKKVGRRNNYIALVSEEEYQQDQTKTFIGKVYEGDVKGLVSTLVQQDLISADELEELQKYWDDGKKNNG